VLLRRATAPAHLAGIESGREQTYHRARRDYSLVGALRFAFLLFDVRDTIPG